MLFPSFMNSEGWFSYLIHPFVSHVFRMWILILHWQSWMLYSENAIKYLNHKHQVDAFSMWESWAHTGGSQSRRREGTGELFALAISEFLRKTHHQEAHSLPHNLFTCDKQCHLVRISALIRHQQCFYHTWKHVSCDKLTDTHHLATG